MNSNDIIEQIRKIENELSERGKKNSIFRYNKGSLIHTKQLEFHKCLKKNRWVFGGNRSGKTECGAVETVWLARGIHPYRENKDSVSCWVVSLSSQVQRDVAQKKLLSYLSPDWIQEIKMCEGKSSSPENGVIDFIIVKNISGKTSRIGFKNCDQGREKFQGTSLDFVWFDEEPPFDIFQECRMRVFDRRGHVFGTMTPLKGLSWVYYEIFLNEKKSSEVWCEHMSWEDNPFLDQKEINLLSDSLSNDELLSRRDGKFVANGGMVYSEFDESVHVIDPFLVPKEWFDSLSIDPGLHNPLSCHWYAVDFDGNIYVIAEHFESGQTIEHHAEKIREISDSLSWPRSSNGMISSLIDSAATQRTLASEKNVVELFYDNGILVNPRVNKDLFSGINRVKSYLKIREHGKPKLFIFRSCFNLIREIKSYWWSNADLPIKNDDHALDELRYYVMSKPEKDRPAEEKSIIQKDKERLARKLKNSYRRF